jgi:phosphate transport system ATP-binding protein
MSPLYEQPISTNDAILEVNDVSVYYGNFRVCEERYSQNSEEEDHRNYWTLGCGKSTVLRSFNRMNDFVAARELKEKYYSMEKHL